jgi:hypothetical protein
VAAAWIGPRPRQKIATQGMRNSNVLAIAPTATISNITATSPCIEPTYKNLFVKSNLSGEFIVLNPFLVKDLKARGLWNQEMIDNLKYYDGELKDIPNVPDDLKARYLTAFDIDPKWIIDAAARRQKWIDQAQSVNLWIKTPDLKTLSHMYRQAWHTGLKTTYYLRSLGASNIEKATVGVRKEMRGAVSEGAAGGQNSGDVGGTHSVEPAGHGRRLPPPPKPPPKRSTPRPKRRPAASRRCAAAKSAKPASKQNVRLIAKSVWKIVSEEARNEIGIKFGTYAANADVARAGAAKDFLTTVEGLSYLPQDALALEISEMVQNLQTAHLAFNNFYNEFPHAKALMGYISQAGTIPAPVRFSYVKTVVMCYIGNGYGVSVAAYAYYQQMVDRFTDDEIWTAAALVTDSEVASRLSLRGCRDRFRKLITHLKGRTSNPAIIAAIDFVLGANDEQIPVIGATTQMRKLLHL